MNRGWDLRVRSQTLLLGLLKSILKGNGGSLKYRSYPEHISVTNVIEFVIFEILLAGGGERLIMQMMLCFSG